MIFDNRIIKLRSCITSRCGAFIQMDCLALNACFDWMCGRRKIFDCQKPLPMSGFIKLILAVQGVLGQVSDILG